MPKNTATSNRQKLNRHSRLSTSSGSVSKTCKKRLIRSRRSRILLRRKFEKLWKRLSKMSVKRLLQRLNTMLR